jgi:hypothetical protein
MNFSLKIYILEIESDYHASYVPLLAHTKRGGNTK